MIRDRGFSTKLSHGEPASLYPDKGFALPALVIQLLIVCVITEFFLILDTKDLNPVFDFHDAVLCAKPISEEEGNRMILPIIEELIRIHGLSWSIQDVNVIKVKKLKYSKKVDLPDSYVSFGIDTEWIL